MFERHVLHGPLFSRRTWGEQLPPLSYRDAGRFFDAWSPADKLRAWAVAGGVPYYLEQFDPSHSLGWNIENRILRKGQVSSHYDEAEIFVKEELGSDAATYLSIIAAVAGGATRQSEIANSAGIVATAAPSYLAQLRRLSVLDHVRPINSLANARSGIWRVADGYLRFWFRFVRPNLTDLEARRSAQVYRERVRPELDHFVSLPAFHWWGPIPDERYDGTRRTRQGEIELVAYHGSRLVFAGEAKWQRGEVGTDALAQLEATVRFVPGFGPDTQLAIYSRDGFTPQLRARADASDVILRTVTDLFA